LEKKMKPLFFLIGLLALPLFAEAKIKPEGIDAKFCPNVVAVAIDPTTASPTQFVNLVDNTTGLTEASDDFYVTPIDLVAHSLRVLSPTAPGAGQDPWVVTLRDDAAATALSCTIDETATSCTDVSDLVSIAAGSKLTVSISATGADADPTDTAELAISFCTNQQ
jgi:hypothetical protein